MPRAAMRRSRKHPEGKKWIRGCSLGCGIVLVLAVIVAGLGTWVITSPFKRAIETRELLEEELGGRTGYRPEPDGTVPAARLEAFLGVRRTAIEHCEKLTRQMKGLEQMDELGEDPAAGDVARRMFGAIRAMTRVGPMTGEFFLQRNRALLRERMSLSEYTYLFVLAYGDRLSGREATTIGAPTRVPITSRVRADLREMLRVQLDAARSDAASSANRAFADLLEHEVDALAADHDRIPWQDGLPVPIESSIAPYREELDRLFCPGILEFELDRNRKFLMGIQSD